MAETRNDQGAPVAPKGNTMKTFLVDFTLGGLSSVISKTLSCPIENLKLWTQLHPPGLETTSPLSLGIYPLLRGNLSNVIRYYPTQILNLIFKSMFKNVAKPNQSYTAIFVRNLLVGGLSGTASLFFVYPLDLTRTLMAYDYSGKKYSGIIDCLSKVIHEGGFLALWTGLPISSLGIFLYRFLYFGLYDILKPLLGRNPSFMVSFTLGWCVTALAGLASYPVDTIRRVQMVHGLNSLEAVDRIWQSTGFTGFLAGAGYNLFRACVGAMVLCLYDYVVALVNH